MLSLSLLLQMPGSSVTVFCLNAKNWKSKVERAFVKINAVQWVMIVQPEHLGLRGYLVVSDSL